MTAATSNAAAGPGVPSSSSNTTTTSTPSSTPAPTAPTAATPTRRPKLAASTSATDSDSAAPNPNAARRSGGGGRHQTAPDPLSDRATSLLIRRTLCPQQLGDKTRDAAHAPVAIEGLLPPLTSRNDVDLQLYALLAIILREFVQSWYAKVTTDDDFVAEIVHVVAHCTRALEQRCRKVDFESLVLDEIPDLVEKHITGSTRTLVSIVRERENLLADNNNHPTAYRAAQHPVATGPVQVDPRQVYHASYPLPPLSPVPRPDDEDAIAEQQRNEAAYRQLHVQAVLAVLLPTEDLENPCLTSLVGQIFSEMIIGGALANKAAQPWLLWEGICILSRIVQEKKSKAAERVAGGSQDGDVDSKPARRWSVHGFFLSIIHLCIFLITSIRLLAGAVAASSSLPRRTRLSVSDADGIEPTKYEGEKYPESTQVTTQQAPATVPILSYKVWSCAGNLLELPSRMPWLHGILSLVQHGAINGPGRLGGLNSTVDR